jgi:ABC-type uncharacterized transport system substrate-binding protein
VAVVVLVVLALPTVGEVQQAERIRRIGVLHYLLENDPEGQAYVRVFLQALQESGWIVDRNLRIDYRWSGGDPDRTRKYAAELVALAPDVILAAGGSQVGRCRTRPGPSPSCSFRWPTQSAAASSPASVLARADEVIE